MCCYIVMKGTWLSPPGTLITSAHVTPFNNPHSPPFSPLLSKKGSERDKECVFVCASERGVKWEYMKKCAPEIAD